jgi:hypothetical protein
MWPGARSAIGFEYPWRSIPNPLLPVKPHGFQGRVSERNGHSVPLFEVRSSTFADGEALRFPRQLRVVFRTFAFR